MPSSCFCTRHYSTHKAHCAAEAHHCRGLCQRRSPLAPQHFAACRCAYSDIQQVFLQNQPRLEQDQEEANDGPLQQNPSEELQDLLAQAGSYRRELLRELHSSSYARLRSCCRGNASLGDHQLMSLLVALQSITFTWRQQYLGAFPDARIFSINQVVDSVIQLTPALGCATSLEAVELIEKHPPLLTLSPVRAAERMLSLKLLVPEADVFSIVSKRPSILQMETAQLERRVGSAVKQLNKLMPSHSWQRSLSAGGDKNLALTFMSMIQS